jgi:hypothetical protein
MRRALAALVLFALAAGVRADGTPTCGDAATLRAARAWIATQCDCAAAHNHSAYVRCVSHAARAGRREGVLAKDCTAPVKKCASHSTCGRAGFVACCRTDDDGATTCSVKEGAKSCHKQGTRGAACISAFASCCDACTSSTCAAFVAGP